MFKAMTKLEEEIKDAIRAMHTDLDLIPMTDIRAVEFPVWQDSDYYIDPIAKVAAEVALEWIKKAYKAGKGQQHLYRGEVKTMEKFLKDNGLK